jgi:hypothetical protein
MVLSWSDELLFGIEGRMTGEVRAGKSACE